jgi:photosystem II stability/assembly factor-like uncharacterized protein
VLNSTDVANRKVAAQTIGHGGALSLVTAVAFIAFGGTGIHPVAAETVASADVRQGLFSACFVDDDRGWAVGDLGRIFHTVDGAATWEIQSAGTKQAFVATACVDSNHAWIAGQAGQMARTTDGGKTWTKMESGTERQLLSIQFADARNGIAVGDFGTILRTVDGGDTWTTIPVPADTRLPEDMIGIVEPGDIVLYAVSYADPQHLAVVGEFGVILTSADGGLTFQSRESPVESTLFGVFLGAGGKGWAVGLEAVMLTTMDGGETWVPTKVPTPPGFSLALYDVAISGSTGWAIGNSGFILSSKDGGSTWDIVDVPSQMGSYWFRGISLLPSGKGYLVGSTGLVLSVDGTKYTPNKTQL